MKINKDKLFNIFIIILFVILSLVVGYFHEPWADEANAWLLARDTSIISLITKYAHSDGHPILWHLILKFFIFFKLPYSKIYLVSLLFSTIGVSLFVCKSKFNKFIKILFSFSYFIFYQYNIVCRGYCLLLPILSSIAIIWEDRHKKIYLFTFLLILLLSTEVYTFIVAGLIYLYLIYDLIKYKYDNKKDHIICFIILFLMFLFTTIYCFPLSSNAFGLSQNDNTYFLSYSFFYPFINSDYNFIIRFGAFVTCFILIFYLYKIYETDKGKLIQFSLFIGLPVLFLIFGYFSGWHIGIITILCLFCFWIHGYHDNKLVIKLLIFSFMCQIPWTVNTVYKDIKYSYYGTKEAADFIKTYDYSNMNIYGFNFYASGINPYFDKNIFSNYSDDVGFFYWDFNGSYFDDLFEYNNLNLEKGMKIKNKGVFLAVPFTYDLSYYLDKNIDIFVTTSYDKNIDELFAENYADLKEYYNEYRFESNFTFELTQYEVRDIYVYVKKDVDWRNNNE